MNRDACMLRKKHDYGKGLVDGWGRNDWPNICDESTLPCHKPQYGQLVTAIAGVH